MDQGVTEKELQIYQDTINKSINDTNLNIKKWDEYKEDYTKLKNVVGNLTDEIQHTAMIPFSNLAFFPGKIVHTNEILVLLGDNWFVERSAKQACKIIDRRIKFVDENLAKLKKDKSELEQKIKFTKKNMPVKHDELNEEGMNYVEIREDYNEDENDSTINEITEKTSKIHIDLNEKKPKKELSAEDEAILRMLKQAELEEEMENEKNKDDEYEEFIKSLKEYDKGTNESKEEEDDEDEEDNDELMKEIEEKKKAFEEFKEKFKKCNPTDNVTKENKKEKDELSYKDMSAIKNPADIYKHMLIVNKEAKGKEVIPPKENKPTKLIEEINPSSIKEKEKSVVKEKDTFEIIEKPQPQQKQQQTPRKKKSSLFKSQMMMKRQQNIKQSPQENTTSASTQLPGSPLKSQIKHEPVITDNAGVKSVVFEHSNEEPVYYPKSNATKKKGKVSLFKSQRMQEMNNGVNGVTKNKIPIVSNVVKEKATSDVSIDEDKLDLYFMQREANQEYQKKKYQQSLIAKEKPSDEINEIDE